VVDLTCVHYPDYYRSGRSEDLSYEKPQLNPFPTVEIGAQFAFCLVLNRTDTSPSALQAARRWLESALCVRGLGAKTASGYGWFSLKPEIVEQIESDERNEAAAIKVKTDLADQERAAIEVAKKRLAAMPPAEAACERFKLLNQEAFAKKVSELASLEPDDQKGLLLELLTPEKRDT